MRFSGRVDTILGSTYWKDGKLISKHTNAMPQELEQAFKDIDELIDLINFHAMVRENAEKMSEPWEEI